MIPKRQDLLDYMKSNKLSGEEEERQEHGDGPEVGGPNMDAPVCFIRMQNYRENDMLMILVTCGHYFHVMCMERRLEESSICPLAAERFLYLGV